MAVASGADRPVAAGAATRRRAIRVTAITRGANREQAATEPAAFLAKRRVHDVGADGLSNWTRTSNRGTRDTTDSVRRSIEAVTEGLEVLRSRPSPRPPSTQRTRRPEHRSNRRGRGR
jgi:hypothetical protein